jgi:hypothetical protein
VDASECPEVRAEHRTGSFTGVAVHLAAAIPIVIASPFMHAVADRRMGRMTATIALPFIGVEYRARSRDICRDQVITDGFGCVIADPETALARASRDDADDGRTIVGKGSVPFPLVRPPSGRIRGVKMGRAFCPRRSGTVRPPQRPCRASPRSAPSCSDWPGCAAEGYGAVSVTGPTHARGAPWARL